MLIDKYFFHRISFFDYFRNTYIKKGIISLFFIFNSCSAPPCQEWQFDAVITKCDTYNSGRLTLPPADLKSISLDLVRGTTGLRMYVNTLLLPFPCGSHDSEKVHLNYLIDNIWYTTETDRLQGGQRLLLSETSTQQIIEALLESKSIQMIVGRYDVVIVSTRFPQLYLRLSQIPIEN
jgi:hypothetical protein